MKKQLTPDDFPSFEDFLEWQEIQDSIESRGYRDGDCYRKGSIHRPINSP